MKFHRFVTRSYDIVQTADLSEAQVVAMLHDLGIDYPLSEIKSWDNSQAIWDYLDDNGFDLDEDVSDVAEDIYDYIEGDL